MDATMWEMGRRAYADGDFNRAVDLYTTAIISGPATAELYFQRSLILVKVGNCTEAVADAANAVRLDKSMYKSHLLMGLAYYKLEQYQSAVKSLLTGLENFENTGFSHLLTRCQDFIIVEANAACDGGDYTLALELYKFVINSGIETAGLYVKCALTLIHLGLYKEALLFLDKATKVEPTMHNAYILKGIALYKLEEYEKAKKILLLGQSYMPENSRFAVLLERCEKGINMQTAEKMPRIIFCNQGNQVIISINAKGVASADTRVSFTENMLSVSIEAMINNHTIITLSCSPRLPERDQMEPLIEKVIASSLESIAVMLRSLRFALNLTSSLTFNEWTMENINFCKIFKVLPDKCKYKILPREVEIRLAKAEDAPWPSISPDRDLTSRDYEFSLISKRINGKDILPPVRDQGAFGTCVHHALLSAAEVELKRQAAKQEPPQSCNVKLNVKFFVAEFEKAGGILGETDTAIRLFMEEGVFAKGKKFKGRKLKMKGYKKLQRFHFSELRWILRKGRPIIGSMPVDRKFGNLGSEKIYDFDPRYEVKENGIPVSHTVVFIGYGVRAGRAYLVFLNSHGVDFGKGGFGRVYLGSVSDLMTIDI